MVIFVILSSLRTSVVSLRRAEQSIGLIFQVSDDCGALFLSRLDAHEILKNVKSLVCHLGSKPIDDPTVKFRKFARALLEGYAAGRNYTAADVGIAFTRAAELPSDE